MCAHLTQPTAYHDVNAVLHEFRTVVEAILRDRFMGMYLHGSLALGDFDPQRSDIDFLVATADEMPDEMLASLAAMHARLATSESLATELEGSYTPLNTLRRYDPALAKHPYHERYGRLRVDQHDSDWVIHRHVLRELGVIVAGPPPLTLIEPISPGGLRAAALDCLHRWWMPMLQDPSRLYDAWYQAYAVLTMCRILNTLQQATVVSKPVAARWAQGVLGEPWTGLFQQALARGIAEPFDHLAETMAFIRYTLERGQRLEPPTE